MDIDHVEYTDLVDTFSDKLIKDELFTAAEKSRILGDLYIVLLDIKKVYVQKVKVSGQTS